MVLLQKLVREHRAVVPDLGELVDGARAALKRVEGRAAEKLEDVSGAMLLAAGEDLERAMIGYGDLVHKQVLTMRKNSGQVLRGMESLLFEAFNRSTTRDDATEVERSLAKGMLDNTAQWLDSMAGSLEGTAKLADDLPFFAGLSRAVNSSMRPVVRRCRAAAASFAEVQRLVETKIEDTTPGSLVQQQAEGAAGVQRRRPNTSTSVAGDSLRAAPGATHSPNNETAAGATLSKLMVAGASGAARQPAAANLLTNGTSAGAALSTRSAHEPGAAHLPRNGTAAGAALSNMLAAVREADDVLPDFGGALGESFASLAKSIQDAVKGKVSADREAKINDVFASTTGKAQVIADQAREAYSSLLETVHAASKQTGVVPNRGIAVTMPGGFTVLAALAAGMAGT